MFVREIKKPNGSSTIAIVESIRVDDKVIQKVIRTFGTHKDPKEISIIKEAAEKIIVEMMDFLNPVLPGLDPAEFHVRKTKPKKATNHLQVEGLEHDGSISVGIQEVFSPLMSEMGLDNIITGTNKDAEWNDNLSKLVLARIEEPVSKLNTSEKLEKDHDIIFPFKRYIEQWIKLALLKNELRIR